MSGDDVLDSVGSFFKAHLGIQRRHRHAEGFEFLAVDVCLTDRAACRLEQDALHVARVHEGPEVERGYLMRIDAQANEIGGGYGADAAIPKSGLADKLLAVGAVEKKVALFQAITRYLVRFEFNVLEAGQVEVSRIGDVAHADQRQASA